MDPDAARPSGAAGAAGAGAAASRAGAVACNVAVSSSASGFPGFSSSLVEAGASGAPSVPGSGSEGFSVPIALPFFLALAGLECDLSVAVVPDAGRELVTRPSGSKSM